MAGFLLMRQNWGKKGSRSQETENDMEGKKARRIFTPAQKFEILTDIERCGTIKEGKGWRTDARA